MRPLRPLTVVACISWCGVAWAQQAPTTDCIQQNVEGQQLQKAGKLVAAASRFAACGADACPIEVRSDCASLLARVQAATPSIVVDGCNDGGDDTSAIAVTVDGRAVKPSLDGLAIPLDPGPHDLVFDLGVAKRESHVVLAEGDKERKVTADFTAPTAPHRCHEPARVVVHPPTHRPIPASAWVSGVTSLVGFGVFGYFGVSGLVDQGQLNQCKPTCSPGAYNDMAVRYYAADIAVGVAGVAAVLALGFYLTRPTVPLAPATLAVRF